MRRLRLKYQERYTTLRATLKTITGEVFAGMIKWFKEISGSSTWNIIREVKKGWSSDKKYYIETAEGRHLLLRVSDISQYEDKKRDYEAMKQLDKFDILVSRPIDFGMCNNGKKVYTLLKWIDGEDAEVVLPKLTKTQQYNLGFKAGETLKKMHQIPCPKKQIVWSERFNNKIDRNIRNYETCGIKFENADKIIGYINKNRHLLNNRK